MKWVWVEGPKEGHRDGEASTDSFIHIYVYNLTLKTGLSRSPLPQHFVHVFLSLRTALAGYFLRCWFYGEGGTGREIFHQTAFNAILIFSYDLSKSKQRVLYWSLQTRANKLWHTMAKRHYDSPPYKTF